jgi:hypothetical protein
MRLHFFNRTRIERTRCKQNPVWTRRISGCVKTSEFLLQFFSGESASVSESSYGSFDCPIDAVKFNVKLTQPAASGIGLTRAVVARGAPRTRKASRPHQHCRQQQRSVCLGQLRLSCSLPMKNYSAPKHAHRCAEGSGLSHWGKLIVGL